MPAHLYSIGKKLIGMAAIVGSLNAIPVGAQFYGAGNENLPNFVCYYRNNFGECTNYSYGGTNRYSHSSTYYGDDWDNNYWYMNDPWYDDRYMDDDWYDDRYHDEYWDDYYYEDDWYDDEDCYWYHGDYLCDDDEDEDDEDCYRYHGVLYCDDDED